MVLKGLLYEQLKKQDRRVYKVSEVMDQYETQFPSDQQSEPESRGRPKRDI